MINGLNYSFFFREVSALLLKQYALELGIMYLNLGSPWLSSSSLFVMPHWLDALTGAHGCLDCFRFLACLNGASEMRSRSGAYRANHCGRWWDSPAWRSCRACPLDLDNIWKLTLNLVTILFDNQYLKLPLNLPFHFSISYMHTVKSSWCLKIQILWN